MLARESSAYNVCTRSDDDCATNPNCSSISISIQWSVIRLAISCQFLLSSIHGRLRPTDSVLAMASMPVFTFAIAVEGTLISLERVCGLGGA